MKSPLDLRQKPRRLKRAIAIALAALALAATADAGWADTWVLDPDNSSIRFSWDHLGLARQFGRFTSFQATLDFAPTEPDKGTVKVSIRAASLLTGVKELDQVLKSADFFDVARNPEITFVSKAARATSERAGEIDGDLTIRGVTKPVTLKVAWNFTGEHPLGPINPALAGRWVSGFSARALVARSDFGLSRGLPLVPDEVEIDIEAEFLRREEPHN